MISAAGSGRGGADGVRWGASLVVVVGLHVAVGFLVLRHAPVPAELPSEPEAVMLELPPEPAAVPPEVAAPAPEPVPPVPEPPVPVPVPPVMPVPEPPPVTPEIQAPPPLPAPDAALPLPPPPRPVPPRVLPPRPAPVRHALPAPPRPLPAPVQAMPAAPVPAASAVSAQPAAPPAGPSNASLSWRSALVGKLARAKRYPEGARSRGEQGTALMTFTMDRGGHVLSASVTRGSGSYQLDEEAVALIHRAEPLPALPDDMPGATVTLTMPIAFALR